jgi:hypothetical protein
VRKTYFRHPSSSLLVDDPVELLSMLVSPFDYLVETMVQEIDSKQLDQDNNPGSSLPDRIAKVPNSRNYFAWKVQNGYRQVINGPAQTTDALPQQISQMGVYDQWLYVAEVIDRPTSHCGMNANPWRAALVLVV